jgi:hypothetical protein
MELAKGIVIPVIADSVLSPDVFYGDSLTGIYFQTQDDQYGRITFESLDALKICRGEYLPYPDNWNEGQQFTWVYKVENSNWQKERYNYEKQNYGSSYEFGGNVEEMQTDFNHYLFKFHDEFIEVIAKGFWFEQDTVSLFKRGFQDGHPFLDLPDSNAEKFVAHSLTCQIRRNQKATEELMSNAEFCSQKLIQFALELEGKTSINNTLVLSYKNGRLISSLRGNFQKEIVEFDGIAELNDVKPYIEKYMKDVFERRKGVQC